MRGLIINADGFGFTFGNNRAIREVLAHGAVKSVSVNANFPAAGEIQELAKAFPDVSLGIHWNLSVGPPVSDPASVRSLLGDDGEFANDSLRGRALMRRLSLSEVRRELEAQLDTLVGFGVQLTHWDSHQNRHILPGFFEVAVEVARSRGIRAGRSTSYHLLYRRPRMIRLAGGLARRPHRLVSRFLAARRSRALRRAGFRIPDYHVGIRPYGTGAEHALEAWRYLFMTLPKGVGCIAVHPGYPDDTLRKYSKMTSSRKREAELLNGPAVGLAAASAGVELVSYYDLLALGHGAD